MEQNGENDNGVDWEITGPDADGLLWIQAGGIMINLGPDEEAVSRLADYLAGRGFGE